MVTIIVLTDFSISARKAGTLAVVIAAQSGAGIVLVNASTERPVVQAEDPAFWRLANEPENDNETALQLEERRLRHHAGLLPSPVNELKLSTMLFKGTLKDCLSTLQKQQKIDLVLMGGGPNTESDSGYMPSDVGTILAMSRSPVLLVPEHYRPKDIITNICFVTDLAKFDLSVVSYIKRFTMVLQAHLFIGHVSKPLFNMDGDEEMKIAAFMAELERLGLHNHEFQNYFNNDIINGIETFCESKNAELLIMVHKQHSQLWKYFHQSVSTIVRKREQIPILMINERSSGDGPVKICF